MKTALPARSDTEAFIICRPQEARLHGIDEVSRFISQKTLDKFIRSDQQVKFSMVVKARTSQICMWVLSVTTC